MATQSYERKKSSQIDAGSADIPRPSEDIKLEGAAERGSALVGSESGIETDVDRVLANPDLLDHERFMAEPIELHLAPAADENEPGFVEVTVNGIYRCAARGDTVTWPRSHVAVLAQAKQMRIEQTKVTNSDGSLGYKETPRLRLTYPFSVIHDANQRGRAWLRQLLQNAA